MCSSDLDAAAAAAHDGRSMAGDTDAWTNLSSFRGHGGKLIFFHGNSDPWFSALETVRYYEQLAGMHRTVPHLEHDDGQAPEGPEAPATATAAQGDEA